MPPGVPPPEPELGAIDMTPICWACGWPMEWTGEEREIDEGGELIVHEPIYMCVNPDCRDDED